MASGLSIEDAFNESKKILEQEAIEKIRNKEFYVNKSTVVQVSKDYVSTQKLSPLQRLDRVKNNIALWVPQNGECKNFTNVRTQSLTKSKYYNYFHALAGQLGLNSYYIPHFRRLLKNYHGTLGEFLEEYQYLLEKKNEVSPLSYKDGINTLFQIEPLRKDAQIVATFYDRYTALNYQRFFGLRNKFFFFWRKSQKQDAYIRTPRLYYGIDGEAGSRSFKCALLGTALACSGYFGIRQFINAAPTGNIDEVTYSVHRYDIAQAVMKKGQINYSNLNNTPDTLVSVPKHTSLPLKWQKPLADTCQIHETTAPITSHKIDGDKLERTPNIDFFNYCFVQSHPKGGSFGISKELYESFMKENKALARMYSVRHFNLLNFNQARVIAKAQIFDKYSIGYMQNSRIGAYMYYILLNNSQKSGYVEQIAKAISHFYDGHHKQISAEQKQALLRLCATQTTVSQSDWVHVVSLINQLKTNTAEEKELFALMQEYEKNIQSDDKIFHFAYTPTLNGCHVDVEHITGTPIQMTDTYTQVLKAQKEKDLETFSKIYMQCCYDNFVKLENGNKSQTFRDANTSLRQHGLSHLSQRYYCAGMSMASFCQAVDIFKAQNPDSHVGKALGKLLDNCRNVHLCNTLKADLNLLTNNVIHSSNLEKDIKFYMQSNKNAIIFGWAPRGKGRFHHQTFFGSSSSSQDAYTYCAFNRQHWGNESTFAGYMSSRSKHGKGGYYADISVSIDKLAEKFIAQDIQKYYVAACENAEQQKQHSAKDVFLAKIQVLKSHAYAAG